MAAPFLYFYFCMSSYPLCRWSSRRPRSSRPCGSLEAKGELCKRRRRRAKEGGRLTRVPGERLLDVVHLPAPAHAELLGRVAEVDDVVAAAQDAPLLLRRRRRRRLLLLLLLLLLLSTTRGRFHSGGGAAGARGRGLVGVSPVRVRLHGGRDATRWPCGRTGSRPPPPLPKSSGRGHTYRPMGDRASGIFTSSNFPFPFIPLFQSRKRFWLCSSRRRGAQEREREVPPVHAVVGCGPSPSPLLSSPPPLHKLL